MDQVQGVHLPPAVAYSIGQPRDAAVSFSNPEEMRGPETVYTKTKENESIILKPGKDVERG